MADMTTTCCTMYVLGEERTWWPSFRQEAAIQTLSAVGIQHIVQNGEQPGN